MCHFIPCFEATIMSNGLKPPAAPQKDLVDMTTAETFRVVKNGL